MSIGRMNMIRKYMLLLLMLWSVAISADNVNAVVLESSNCVECSGMDKYTWRYNSKCLILNEKARSKSSFVFETDKTQKIQAFTAVITDENGNVLKKLKKSDLLSTSYNPDMVTDGKTYYFDYVPPRYPITVSYTLEMTFSNGFLSFPTFVPQRNYDTEVRHASYSLVVPADMKVSHMAKNVAEEHVKERTEEGKKIITVELNDLQALKREQWSPDFDERIPLVYFSPSIFEYYGTSGHQSTWQELGKWHWQLLEGRDHLPVELENQLHQFTDTCQTQIGKIEQLYRLLERTTRYVSIQLGLGGLQPESAADVYRHGMGDCKGLSNLMRAMLKAVGIESFYTIISTENKHLFRDYANVSQLNHAILAVPTDGDTLWLECTDASLPLGYLHDDIAGHDAIVITSEGGRFVTLPEQDKNENRLVTEADVYLQQDGSAEVNITLLAKGSYYQHLAALQSLDNSEKKKMLQRMFRLPQASFSELTFTLSKTPYNHPQVKFSVKASCKGIASVTGNRIFVPLNPIEQESPLINVEENRTSKVQLSDRGITEDIVRIHIPEGYVVENMPKSDSLQSLSSVYTSRVEKTEDGVKVTDISRKDGGIFDVGCYKEYAEYTNTILRRSRKMMVLRK